MNAYYLRAICFVTGFSLATLHPHSSVAQTPAEAGARAPVMLGVRDQISLLISELEQSVRKADTTRLARSFDRQVQIAKPGQVRSLNPHTFIARLLRLDVGEDTATAICRFSDQVGEEIQAARIEFRRSAWLWRITHIDSLGLLFIASDGGLRSQKAMAANGAVTNPQIISVPNALIAKPHLGTSEYVITKNLANQNLQKDLFSPAAILDLGAVLPSINGYPIGFISDRFWNRILYSCQDPNNTWLKSYGDNQGDYAFSTQCAISIDPFDTLFVADDDHGKIVKLFYSPALNTLTCLSAFSVPGIRFPSDLSFDCGSSVCDPNDGDGVWIADATVGKVMKLNRAGQIVRSFKYYYIRNVIGGPYRLSNPVKVFAHAWYSPSITLIDGTRNAYLTFGNDMVNDSTVLMNSSVEFDPATSQLTSIGEDITGQVWVSDSKLRMLHTFNFNGVYTASVGTDNNGMQLFTSPQAISRPAITWQSGCIIYGTLDMITADPWGPTTGFRDFYPGADAINLTAVKNGNLFDFGWTITNLCQDIVEIVDANNYQVYSFGSGVAGPGPGWIASVPRALLPAGQLKFRVSVLPYDNNYYLSYARNWLVREVPFEHVPPQMQSYTPNATATGGQRKLVRGSSGMLYCVYDSEGDILFTKSTNNGTTWSTVRYLSGGTTGCKYPCITERNGSLYVVWQRPNFSNWDIVYTMSNNPGLEWAPSPTTLIQNVSCASPGPTPIIMAGTPSNAFELLIVYRYTAGLKSSHTSNTWPSSGSWSTINVNGTGSTSRDPALAYQANSYGYYYLTWANGVGIYNQKFYGSSWTNPVSVNGGLAGSVYDNYLPTYALTQNYDHHIAWEGTRPPWREIIHNRNFNPTVFTEFVYQYYSNYYAPTITGHDNGRASLLWHGPGDVIYQVTNSNGNWYTPATIYSGAKYPASSINNPPGGQAWAVWTRTSGPPYSIIPGPSSGPLQKAETDSGFLPTAVPTTHARRLALSSEDGTNWVSIELEDPVVRAADGSLRTLPFVPLVDTIQYNGVNVWGVLETIVCTLPSPQVSLAANLACANRLTSNITVPALKGGFGIELVGAASGKLLARQEWVPVSNDTSTSGLVELKPTNAAASSMPVKLRIRPLAIPSGESIRVAVVDVYRQSTSTSAPPMEPPTVPQSSKPAEFLLHNAYPVPFNPSTTIDFELPENSYVSLEVFDILGRQVAVLANGNYEPGYHSVVWNARSAASGIYYARFTASDEYGKVKYRKVTKLLLVR